MRLKPITAIVVANLKRQVRDRVGMFFLVIMPFVTTLFVGMALGGSGTNAELPVGVVASDSDATAQAVVRELEADGTLAVARVATEDQLGKRVRRGTLAAGLVMEPGATTFDLLLVPSSGSSMAALSKINVAIGREAAVQEAIRAAEGAGATPQQARQYVHDAQQQHGTVAVARSGEQDDTPQGFAYTAPANLLLFTFINSMAVAAALVDSRQLGMIRRTLAAPLKQGSVLFGEALSRFLVAAAQSLLIIVGTSLFFGVAWGNRLGVGVVVGVFCLISTGAAMFVGALVKEAQQAPAIGPPLGIVLGMLGGCLWPREAAGELLSTIGYAVPHAWALDALLTLNQSRAGLTSVIPQIAVLTAMATIVLGAALIVFRRKAFNTA